MTRPVGWGNWRLLRDLVSVGRGWGCDLVCVWVASGVRGEVLIVDETDINGNTLFNRVGCIV